jgi:hypothetical protein
MDQGRSRRLRQCCANLGKLVVARHGENLGKHSALYRPPAPIPSAAIKRLAVRGLVAPTTLTIEEFQQLAASARGLKGGKSARA